MGWAGCIATKPSNKPGNPRNLSGTVTDRLAYLDDKQYQETSAMFCSGCGQPLTPGQSICPQCNRPVTPSVPLVAGLEFQLANYAGKVKALSVVWFIYAGFSILSGFIGLAFADAILAGRFGPWASEHWMNGPMTHSPVFPFFFGRAILHFAWVAVLIRTGLAFAAGWGLMERAQWGRIVAIIAAFLSILKFPIGTAIGIFTLVVLMGYRNTRLFDQLENGV
jgi:hypothetical protein